MATEWYMATWGPLPVNIASISITYSFESTKTERRFNYSVNVK